jgi:hypothetical protein
MVWNGTYTAVKRGTVAQSLCHFSVDLARHGCTDQRQEYNISASPEIQGILDYLHTETRDLHIQKELVDRYLRRTDWQQDVNLRVPVVKSW